MARKPAQKTNTAQKRKTTRKTQKKAVKKPAYDALKDPRFRTAATNLKKNDGVPKSKGGRPDEYHPVMTQLLLDLIDKIPKDAPIEETVWTKAKLADVLGRSRRTLDAWCEKHPEFLRAVEKHRNRLLIYYQDRMLKSALDGTGNSRSIAFALKNLDPENYKDRHDVETRATNVNLNTDVDEDSHVVDVSSLSAEQKRALLNVVKS